MGEERRNGVAEEVVEEEEEEGRNGEADGGLSLRSRSRKKVLLEQEVEIGGDAVVGAHLGVDHDRSVYLDQEQGVTFLDETKGSELEKVDQLVAEKSMQNHKPDCLSEHAEDFPVVENHHGKDLKDEHQPTSVEERGKILTGRKVLSQSEEITPSDDNKPVVEMDLLRILEEQDTHDLYCPNCHSCITRRVILRKRKRTSIQTTLDAKREKLEPIHDLTADNSAAEGETRDTEEPDVFRCLSCLSFFIPTGTGFRLFKNFGRREKNEIVQSSQQASERHQSWIFSLFETRKHKTKESGPEKPLLAESHDGYGGQADYSERTEQITLVASSSEAMPPGKPQKEFKEDQLDAHKTNGAGDVQYSGKDVNAVSSPRRLQSLGHPPEEVRNVSISSQQSPIDIIGIMEGQVEQVKKGSIQYAAIPSNQESFAFEKIESEKVEKWHVSREDNEEIRITVQEVCLKGPRIDSSLTTPIPPGPPILDETRVHVREPIMTENSQARQWDVLKAIVYGGLLESIASLSVISSAAGSGVTTLNVIALGLANLITGLLVLIHNLSELKSEQYKSISNSTESDRYWELLGRRGHFNLHAAVALISYILVGMLPPVVYGFSFRRSDNREYKLIAVAGASLICIALLAIAKAHVQERRRQYIKTLLYYVGLGVSGSGLSYAVGMLIEKLLQELGLFDGHSSLLSPPFSSGILEMTPPVTPSWGPY